MTHRNVGSMDKLVGFITGKKTLDPNLQTIITKAEVASLLMKNQDVLAKKDIITICP